MLAVGMYALLTSTTVVDPVVSWFHTISFSGGWNYGDDPGPSDIASRLDCRYRVGVESGVDGGGATAWSPVCTVGSAAACRGISAGLTQSSRTQKRVAIGRSQWRWQALRGAGSAGARRVGCRSGAGRFARLCDSTCGNPTRGDGH